MIFLSFDFVQDTSIEYHILMPSLARIEFKSVSMSPKIFTTINADFYHKIAFLISDYQFRSEKGNLCYVGFNIETLPLELNKRD